uniref:CCHC-type domain-containing protein n=1 Tax=Peronospora matthiolae TaxID=2874970 RepID=A0AAV1V6N0_9STRA
MHMVLEERDLWEVTCGEVKLEHCTNVMDQSTFKRKSRKALAIICLAIEDSQLPLVRSASGAHDAWSRLEGHFEKKSLANKLFLRRRFFTTMMDEGDDVLEHINNLKTLAEQLDAVGAPISEDDFVITLLGNLSDSYQFLITALESRADTLTWELVTSRLLHEDMKRKEQGGGVDGSAHGQGQAFMTSNHSKRKRGRPVQKASACHYCGEQGHWIAKCPVRIRENAERQRSQKRASVAQVEDDTGEFLFSVDGDNIKLSEEWLVDSGATQHMTYSKEYMKNYQKISPVDVHLADDGVDIGHVTFESDGCFAQSKSVKWQLDEANVSSSTGFNGTNRSYLWHLRLGHIGHNGLDSIVKKGYGNGINITSVQQWEMCQGCALGKQTRVNFMPKSPESAKKMLEVIHSDVCGPMQTASLGGSRYFVTFNDEYSHFSVVFFA